MPSVRDRLKALTFLAICAAVWACADVWTPPTGPSPTGPSPTGPSPTGPGADPPVVTRPALAVSGTSFTYGSRPFVGVGITAFDLPRRLAQGDRSFLTWVQATGFNAVRILVARQSGHDPRTYDEGLRELGPALDTLEQAGLIVEVVVLADTADYGFSWAQIRDVTSRVAAIVSGRPGVLLELSNEPDHHTQHPRLATRDGQAELLALLPRGMPTSGGSSHGGQPPLWDTGSIITHHADRSRSPEENAAIMGAAQRRLLLPVLDDEAIGAGEVDEPGRRTSDPEYGARQVRAARAEGLSWVTWHCEACLSARVPGPRQQEAARRFVEAWR